MSTTPSTLSRPSTPPTIRAQLHSLLSQTQTELAELRAALAQSNQRAAYFESLLPAEVRDAEKRLRSAERERDLEAARTSGLVRMWTDLSGHLAEAEEKMREGGRVIDRWELLDSDERVKMCVKTTANANAALYSPTMSTTSQSVDDMLLEASTPRPHPSSNTPHPLSHLSTTFAVHPPVPSYPAIDPKSGNRLCRQCGVEGRMKDGKCIEKWGPGVWGPGTVCDRCRKKTKRIERRESKAQQQQPPYSYQPHRPQPQPRPPSHSHSEEDRTPMDEEDYEALLLSRSSPPPPPPAQTAEDELEQLVLSSPKHVPLRMNESSLRTGSGSGSEEDADGDLLEAVEASEAEMSVVVKREE